MKDLPIAREAAASLAREFRILSKARAKKSAGGSPPAEDIVASQVF
ncbi:MAG TPA: hypothetical protein VNX23_20805 [Bradyrhizobium sp.]|nr:hypothetical protein [Bradyrhizobium sp.]HXB79811.1 hypothetical protein [Bradyrhizobium sp.]